MGFRVQISVQTIYITTQRTEKSSIFQMIVFVVVVVVVVVFGVVVFQNYAQAVYNHTKDLENVHLSDYWGFRLKSLHWYCITTHRTEKICLFQVILMGFRVQISLRAIYVTTQRTGKISICQTIEVLCSNPCSSNITTKRTVKILILQMILLGFRVQISARTVYNHTTD